jgi:hypothetical protein
LGFLERKGRFGFGFGLSSVSMAIVGIGVKNGYALKGYLGLGVLEKKGVMGFLKFLGIGGIVVVGDDDMDFWG